MWQLNDQLATAQWHHLPLRVSLAMGQRHVTLGDGDPPLAPALWQMPTLASLPLVEAYVRGSDLVARLEPGERFPFHTELYWTLRELPAEPLVAALSLVVSVRTELLDTYPELPLASSIAGEVQRYDVGAGPAFATRLSSGQTLIDYAVPEDCQSQSATAHSVERKLFAHFLEKGVIRRARLFAAVAPGEVSPARASAICRQLAEGALPLTT